MSTEASPGAGPAERTIELAGGRFKTRVLTAGPASGATPVLYLHGAAGLVWDPFVAGLAAHHRVVAPEHPGTGESQGLEHLHDLWDLVLYHGELLDALGLDRVAVVGHSFGGMVALELAANNPERVTGVVAVAPIGLWLDDHPVPDLATLPPRRVAELLLSDPDGPMARLLAPPDPGDPEALFRASLTAAAVNQFIWPLPDKGLDRRLYRIGAPTLLVWGADDGFVDPAYGRAFARLIDGARLEVVPGAGHLPQLEQAAVVRALVEGFLTSVDPGA